MILSGQWEYRGVNMYTGQGKRISKPHCKREANLEGRTKVFDSLRARTEDGEHAENQIIHPDLGLRGRR
jgi:hypothetical protein